MNGPDPNALEFDPFMGDQHGAFVKNVTGDQHGAFIKNVTGAQHNAFIEENPEPTNKPAPPVDEEAAINYNQVFVDLRLD
jgi:hypothetical protein